MGVLEGIAATSIAQESSEGPPISEVRERLSALEKPYPGAPIVLSQGIPIYQGLNFGQTQAQDRGSAVFPMGISKAQAKETTPSGIGRNDEKEQKETNSSTIAMPASICEPG